MATPIIVGAGLAGLIAAHAWPNFKVFERNSAPAQGHKALLRFRTDAVAKLTGIEFRQVQVRKGLWSAGAFRAPTIALANSYSRKCLGRILPDRSIWNLDPAMRYVAPDDFYDRLIETASSRITWGVPWDPQLDTARPVVTTAPLPVTLGAFGIETDLTFDRADIVVSRARLDDCTAFQTVYYPDPEDTLYRASITGSNLIAEFVGEPQNGWFQKLISPAFCIGTDQAQFKERRHGQQYGKIAPVADDAQRKDLLHQLTAQHDVFSLGRFATWRNILLDDVVDDISVVKRLMNGSRYERRRIMS